MIDLERFQIILDIDGVLVSYREMKVYESDGEHKFMSSSVEALNTLITYFDADLCMVSSWNSKFRDEEQYKEFLESRGVIVNGLTFADQHNRYKFVEDLIADGMKDYLIVDDEAYGYYEACMVNHTIEYKRILKPDRIRCLDIYDADMYCNWIKNKKAAE